MFVNLVIQISTLTDFCLCVLSVAEKFVLRSLAVVSDLSLSPFGFISVRYSTHAHLKLLCPQQNDAFYHYDKESLVMVSVLKSLLLIT